MLKRFISRLVIGGGIAIGLLTAGCIAVGGSETHTQPTLGRQLQDLKSAHDTGAISDVEYNDTRTKLINGDYLRKK